MKKQRIKTKHGTIVVESWQPPAKPKPRFGRPPGPLSAIAYEKELAALKRLHASGELTTKQYNDKYVALVTRLREGN
jgi:hypothetical protein